jgi:hypothetical protein
MKNLKFLLFASLLLLCAPCFSQPVTGSLPVDTSAVTDTTTQPAGVVPGTGETVTPPDKNRGFNLITFLKERWQDILLWFIPLLWFIVRLTPTKKDDDFVKIILSWLDAVVPNRKAAGGVHATYSDASTAPKLAYVPKKQ